MAALFPRPAYACSGAPPETAANPTLPLLAVLSAVLLAGGLLQRRY